MNIGPQQQHNWDWRAAANFIGGGSGSGLLLAAAVAAPTGIDIRLAATAALLLVAGGLGLVWLETGRPARFANVFRNRRSSWMTREAWTALLLLPLAAATAVTGWLPLLLAAALPAALFLYCQARILKAARGIPAWRLDEIVPLVVATGLAEGAGLLLLLLPLVGSPRPPAAFLGTLVLALVLVRWFNWRCYWKSLGRGAPVGSLRALAPAGHFLLLAGTVLPALLGLALTLEPAVQPLLMGLTGAAMTAAGWLLKLVLIIRAGYNQGYAIPAAPARGAGRSGPGSRPGWQPPLREERS